MFSRICGATLALFCWLGCAGSPASSLDSRPNLENLPAAFDVDPNTPEGVAFSVQGSQVTLRRAALGKKFLLNPALLLASAAPSAFYLKSQVVYFHSHGNSLGLFEIDTNAVYPSFASDKLVRTFPLVAQDEQTLTFRWEGGFDAIELAQPMVLSDLPGTPPPVPTFTVSESFLEALVVRNNTLELRQIATLYPEPNSRVTAHLVYRLMPLDCAGQLAPRLSTRQRGVGFIETEGVRPGDGGTDFYAARWDVSQGPVTYAISRGAPPNLEAAIREGVLYWNRVAGDNLVQVSTGADPLALPPWGHVLIRWVPFARGAFAYATIQTHPITGEILAGEIYLPSFWSTAAAYGTQNVLQALQGPATQESLCHLATTALAPEGAATAETRTRSAGDTLRAVVAHEVGHTLGLRHNFAASTATVLPNHQALHTTFGDYLHNARHPGAKIASSVMDYTNPLETVLLGAYIEHAALPYDEAAIHWGYNAEPAPVPGDLVFCTDIEALQGAASGLWGCQPHDSGRNPIDGLLGNAIVLRQQLARTIVDALLSQFVPLYPGDAAAPGAPFQGMEPGHFTALARFTAGRLLHDLSDKAQVLQVRRAAEAHAQFDAAMERQQSQLQLQRWLREVGGIPGFLTQAYGMEDARDIPTGRLRREVESILQARGLAVGGSMFGQPYQLIEAQTQAIRAFAPAFADRVEQTLLRDLILGLTAPATDSIQAGLANGSPLLALLAAPPGYDTEIIDPTWEAPLGALAESIILSTTSSAPQAAENVAAAVYPLDLRLAATGLLSPAVFGLPQWQAQTRQEITNVLLARLSSIASIDINILGVIKMEIPDELPASTRQWAKEELRVIAALQALRM